jgi:hypothetical protein
VTLIRSLVPSALVPAQHLTGHDDRFVDRDMFMRYRGGGIGHKYMREIEAVYEDMSRERIHHKKGNRRTVHPEKEATTGTNHYNPESESEDDHTDPQASQGTQAGRQGDAPIGGGDRDHGDDDVDDDYVPSSDDSCSSGVSDSDDLDSDTCAKHSKKCMLSRRIVYSIYYMCTLTLP